MESDYAGSLREIISTLKELNPLAGDDATPLGLKIILGVNPA